MDPAKKQLGANHPKDAEGYTLVSGRKTLAQKEYLGETSGLNDIIQLSLNPKRLLDMSNTSIPNQKSKHIEIRVENLQQDTDLDENISMEH